MAPTRTLLVVLAGGAGARLEALTDRRASAALPFGGTHRLIDFPLSHAANSGISDVWVLAQHHPVSVSEHLAGGRPWDLDRTRGGVLVVAPEPGDHLGTADALARRADAIRRHEPEVVLVASADAVYRMDFADVVARHAASGAELTVVTTRHGGDLTRHDVVQVQDGRVTEYAHRPERPRGDLVARQVLAFGTAALLAGLEEVRRGRGGDGLGDIGDHLLPAMVARGGALEHRHPGYWQQVGTVEEYWRAHMALLDRPPFDVDDPAWPVTTRVRRHAPARLVGDGRAENAVVGPGTVVEGTVRRSVLGPGVRVAAGAEVVDSVLLDDVRVGPGAVVRRTVVDEGARVRGRAEVGGAGENDAVALVAAHAVVHSRKRVAAGGRYPE
ncbi:glucose-1-phosphate adenylyltransferase [Georgenia soli]|uniref:Glucose-1-phosphate adenylyltransferase n=1 Tax=Georgenia soli TaxID=638953 RepID=A0A2A9EII7_9MICO|nr:sugar phosphate nucleotidyltransferase [Georgenia soli]PFG38075.1 glucose-1-phosphate adenylyltransferase [Georgenia soli]